MSKGFLLNLLAGLDERNRRHVLEVIAEMVSDCRLQDLVDQIGHRADARYHPWSFRIRHVDLHLQIDLEDEPFAALRLDLFEPLVEVVGHGNNVGPVQSQDRRRDDLCLVASRVDRVLARSQRLLPDSAVARTNEAPELEIGTRRILRHEADISFDNGHLALLDDQHRNELHADQEGVECIRAV